MKQGQKSQKNSVNQILIFGRHPVLLALQKKRREIFEIFCTKNNFNELQEFLNKNNLSKFLTKIKIVDPSYISKLVGENNLHQNFAVKASLIPFKSQNNLLDEIDSLIKEEKKLPVLLILDQIFDPHNVGAIIRSAVAFGVNKIIFPDRNFCKESSVVNKSSSGNVENIDQYLVVNITQLLEKLKARGYWSFGLDGGSEKNISEIKNFENIVIIVGSEGSGIRNLIKKNCDMLLKIPISQDVESLNASVATSIALYEAVLKP